jgi:hypothetical protein
VADTLVSFTDPFFFRTRRVYEERRILPGPQNFESLDERLVAAFPLTQIDLMCLPFVLRVKPLRLIYPEGHLLCINGRDFLVAIY